MGAEKGQSSGCRQNASFECTVVMRPGSKAKRIHTLISVAKTDSRPQKDMNLKVHTAKELCLVVAKSKE